MEWNRFIYKNDFANHVISAFIELMHLPRVNSVYQNPLAHNHQVLILLSYLSNLFWSISDPYIKKDLGKYMSEGSVLAFKKFCYHLVQYILRDTPSSKFYMPFYDFSYDLTRGVVKNKYVQIDE